LGERTHRFIGIGGEGVFPDVETGILSVDAANPEVVFVVFENVEDEIADRGRSRETFPVPGNFPSRFSVEEVNPRRIASCPDSSLVVLAQGEENLRLFHIIIEKGLPELFFWIPDPDAIVGGEPDLSVTVFQDAIDIVIYQ